MPHILRSDIWNKHEEQLQHFFIIWLEGGNCGEDILQYAVSFWNINRTFSTVKFDNSQSSLIILWLIHFHISIFPSNKCVIDRGCHHCHYSYSYLWSFFYYFFLFDSWLCNSRLITHINIFQRSGAEQLFTKS